MKKILIVIVVLLLLAGGIIYSGALSRFVPYRIISGYSEGVRSGTLIKATYKGRGLRCKRPVIEVAPTGISSTEGNIEFLVSEEDLADLGDLVGKEVKVQYNQNFLASDCSGPERRGLSVEEISK